SPHPSRSPHISNVRRNGSRRPQKQVIPPVPGHQPRKAPSVTAADAETGRSRPPVPRPVSDAGKSDEADAPVVPERHTPPVIEDTAPEPRESPAALSAERPALRSDPD